MLINIIYFLLVFTVVALAHEAGHFFAAKKAGIRVFEFGLGFGPKLLSLKHGDTVYALNLIPILAYVKIAGTEDDLNEEPCPESQKYYTKPVLSKFAVSFFGPAMNIVLAFLILFSIFSVFGVPKDISNIVDRVSPGSPADISGLKSGDSILSIDNIVFPKIDKAIDYIHKNPGKVLLLKIDRQGKYISIRVAPLLDPKLKIGLIGFSPRPVYEKVSLFSALYYGLQQTLAMIALMFIIIGQLLTGAVSLRDLAGPVGIAQITGKYAQAGWLSLFHFVAFLNVNIGVLNLLPIPALDGGRLVFVGIEAVRKKPIDIETENKIHQWGFIFLLMLMAVVTLNDILRILRPR